jgi:hypothetical protein
MSAPHSLIVPDSKPPVFLLSVGATLLAGLIIHALRRRHRRASSSRGTVVVSTGKTVKPPASSRAKARPPALLEASTRDTARGMKPRATVAPSER